MRLLWQSGGVCGAMMRQRYPQPVTAPPWKARACRGSVANTAANRNQIQWAGSVTVWAQARPIHVVLIARNIQEGVDIMENVTAGGAGTLVDIRDVTVDRELSREDRIAEFVRQIKNPYRFKCGRFTVHASFASSGATLEECIKGILR